MKRGESIIDRRFGRLVVVSEAGKDRWKCIRYLCQCDCGNKTTVVRGSLLRGATKSCGCLQKEGNHPGEKHRNYVDGRKNVMKRYFKKYSKENPEIIAARNAKRRARKLNQTPILTENEKRKISLYYQIAIYLGEDFHVDHIHPLSRGGLHHPDNLQILTAAINLQKSNKYPLTNEEEIKYKGIRI